MKINEYAENIFGQWRAYRRKEGQRPQDYEHLEDFEFSPQIAVDAVRAEIAKRHGLSPDEIWIFNAEDEPDVEEGVLNKINGGKRRKRRKVNVSQREI